MAHFYAAPRFAYCKYKYSSTEIENSNRTTHAADRPTLSLRDSPTIKANEKVGP